MTERKGPNQIIGSLGNIRDYFNKTSNANMSRELMRTVSINLKTRFVIMLCLCFLGMSFGIVKDQPKYEAIQSGIALFDQLNNVVNAHGSCIVKEGNRYYLFGEYHSDNSNAFFVLAAIRQQT